MSEELNVALAMFAVLLLILIVARPEPVFDSRTGTARPFGTRRGQTLLCLPVVLTAGAAACFHAAVIYTK